MNKALHKRYHERSTWCHQSFHHVVGYRTKEISTNRVPLETVMKWSAVARNPWRRRIWEAAVRLGMEYENKEKNLPPPTDAEVEAEVARQEAHGLTLKESERFVGWLYFGHELIRELRAKKAASVRWQKPPKKVQKVCAKKRC